MTTLAASVSEHGLHAARRANARARRVILLLVFVIVLSLADLYLTILYLADAGGFPEANPLARAIMSTQSIPLLVLWKLGTVFTAVGILYAIRRTRSAELGAWVCFLVLGWLTVHWGQYVSETHPMALAQAVDYGYQDPSWVSISPTSARARP
ncbi:MAG: hypothetical protein D6695_01180 [Planctomycetota bacterium]|nr:MAG: hypothetical protein D6695_01180 [Planctomycetota bacterium]